MDKIILIVNGILTLFTRITLTWYFKLCAHLFFVITKLTKNTKLQINLSFIYLFAGPLSVDRFTEIDDDADVDVEQCSDSEAQSRTTRTSQQSSTSPPSPSDEERLTPEPVQVNVWLMKIKLFLWN